MLDFASLSFKRPFSSHGSLIDESPIVMIARSVCFSLSYDFFDNPTEISNPNIFT